MVPGPSRRGEQEEHAAFGSMRLLAAQLRDELPDARMCARCGFGPVDHGGCYDLRTHHGYGIVSSVSVIAFGELAILTWI